MKLFFCAFIVLMQLATADEMVSPTPTQALSAEVMKAAETCRTYIEELGVIYELDETGERFKSEASIPAVLEKVDPEKGFPAANRKYFDYFVKKLPKITTEDVQNVFYDGPPCNATVREYSALKGLLGSVRHFKAGLKFQADAVKKTLDYVKRRIEWPGTLIDQNVHVSLLEKLRDGKFIHVGKDQKATLASLRKRGETIKLELRNLRAGDGRWPESSEAFLALNKQRRDALIKEFTLELQRTEELRTAIRDLVRKL